MLTGTFQDRSELSAYEWQDGGRNWCWPDIDKSEMERLLTRSTWNGLARVALFLSLLLFAGAAALVAARYSLWLAVLPLYGYYFLYGFWVAIGHELQHSTVFARSFNGVNEVIFHAVQALMWSSPTYARKSHQLHQRYTMVRGVDPETNWPEVITTKWLRGVLVSALLRVVVVGAVVQLWRDVVMQITRAMGRKDRMMRDHCSAKELAAIRRESLGILLFHLAIVAIAILFHRWELLLLITVAWQIGSAFEGLWHNTEHIGRLYNVNNQTLCTRSVRVGPFIRMIYFGLDDHIDHHLFPAVPSRNLPRLHRLLQQSLPEPQSLLACWREMFAIAGEKDARPQCEYVPATACARDDDNTE